ncbi:MAG: hypothetical protein QNL12_11360 [Acidimicrobiia bacterium]|nr:hypothetical protein [Acidimicrobiia bacterium]MDX2467903.1 hypothetical protein [Acidimicrobiia bacterium]
MTRMRRNGLERAEGPRFGPPFGGRGRGGMMRDFFTENPDCAEKMARFGVAKMREDGLSDDEIREHMTHMKGRNFLPELDIDHLLV